MPGRATSMTTAIAISHGQVSERKRSGGMVETSVTTLPMNHGTAVSSSATNSSITNSRMNRPFACFA